MLRVMRSAAALATMRLAFKLHFKWQVEGSAAKAERGVRGGLRLPMSNGCEELGRLTVGLKEEEARELAVHAARGAADKGDERNGVIVSILSAVGVDFLTSTLLQGSIYVVGRGGGGGCHEVDLPTAAVALVGLLKVSDKIAGPAASASLSCNL